MFQVIEHVPNAKGFIKIIKKSLNQNGCLLISTPDKTNRIINKEVKDNNAPHFV